MKTNVRKMLDQIDEFMLNTDSDARRHLWDILTALRGPDVGHGVTGYYQLKYQTTGTIRAVAFPRSANLLNSSLAVINYDGTTENAYKAISDDGVTNSYHFRDHIRKALYAIEDSD